MASKKAKKAAKPAKKAAKVAKNVAKKVTKKAAKKAAPKAAAKKTAKKTVKTAAKKPTPQSNKKSNVKSGTKMMTKAAAAPKSKMPSLDLSQFLSPLDDRLIVQIAIGERVTAGGLFIPDTAAVAGNKKGLVLAVGRGHRDAKGRVRPMDVKQGDQVLFTEYAGDEIEILGQKVQILRETDVMGVVTD